MFKVGDEILVRGQVIAIAKAAGCVTKYHVTTGYGDHIWTLPDELVAAESGRVFEVSGELFVRGIGPYLFKTAQGDGDYTMPPIVVPDEFRQRIAQGGKVPIKITITEIEPEKPLSTEERIASLEKRIAELEGGKCQ